MSRITVASFVIGGASIIISFTTVVRAWSQAQDELTRTKRDYQACQDRWFQPGEERPTERPMTTIYPPNWACTLRAHPALPAQWTCSRVSP